MFLDHCLSTAWIICFLHYIIIVLCMYSITFTRFELSGHPCGKTHFNTQHSIHVNNLPGCQRTLKSCKVGVDSDKYKSSGLLLYFPQSHHNIPILKRVGDIISAAVVVGVKFIWNRGINTAVLFITSLMECVWRLMRHINPDGEYTYTCAASWPHTKGTDGMKEVIGIRTWTVVENSRGFSYR